MGAADASARPPPSSAVVHALLCQPKQHPLMQVAQFGKDLGLPTVEVQTCGCLGKPSFILLQQTDQPLACGIHAAACGCEVAFQLFSTLLCFYRPFHPTSPNAGGCGTGPNVAVIPLDGTQPLLLRHVGTPQRMAELLREVCSQQVDDTLLKATELRLAGNAAARRGDLQGADELYSRGIELAAPTGRHMLLSNRSGVRLEMGDAASALDDANAAAECCPPEFTTAAIRQVEALLRLAHHRAAMDCLLAAQERHPSWGQSDEYLRCVADVQKAMAGAGR